MKFTILFLIGFSMIHSLFAAEKYPSEWWKEIPRSEAKDWEILPQDAKSGEVILSKRTELGVFSNLARAPFDLDGIHYNSIEGLWQGMKYPDPNLKDDPRTKISGWGYTRAEVYLLADWDAKGAGTKANELNKKNNIEWISYQDKKFNYRDNAEGSAFHYDLILKATRAKLAANPKMKELLFKTKGLFLKPDHKQNDQDPPAYRYFDILMKIRDEK